MNKRVAKGQITVPTGMRLYNLCEMAKALRMDFTVIMNLLTQIGNLQKSS